MSIGDVLLVEPAPGETVQIGAFTVHHRVTELTKGKVDRMFVVHNGHGELCAMGRSFRRLAHFRRWQLDPMTAVRRTKDGELVVMDEPEGWPESEMNAWQLLCWHVVRRTCLPEIDPGPITRVHPDCVKAAEKRRPDRRAHRQEERRPEARAGIRMPAGPTVPRGPADDEGQFSLWGDPA